LSRIVGAGASSAIPDSYIVKLKDTTSVRAVGVAARGRLAARTMGSWAISGSRACMAFPSK